MVLTVATRIGYPGGFTKIVGMCVSDEVDLAPMINHCVYYPDFHKPFEIARRAQASANEMETSI